MDASRLQNSTDITKRGVRKEFTKCLTLILTVAKLYPVKRYKGTPNFCGEAMPFFIFPPNRCRHKKQLLLIKRAEKFQEGKWEDLWKQSLNVFEIERRTYNPRKKNLSLTKCVKGTTNSQLYLGRLKNSQAIRSQHM